nr:hypothetical protein [Cytophagales bacterium]
MALSDIRPTEEIIESHLEAIKASIKSGGYITTALCVEEDTGVLMDGHHRFRALQALGYTYAPVLRLSYDDVEVINNLQGRKMDPQEIIDRGMEGLLYPPKTTKHIFSMDLSCYIPLTSLGADGPPDARIHFDLI